MLDLKLLQKNPEVVAAALAKRHSPLNMRTFEELDNKRRELLAQVEALKAERNRASAEVARLKRNGEDAEAFIASLSDLSSRISALDSATEAVKADLADWMLTVPNIPDASVPDGVDENDNVEVHRWGTPREHPFPPQRRQAGMGAYPERFRPAHRPLSGGHHGKLSAEGRLHRGPQGPRALHGRSGSH